MNTTTPTTTPKLSPQVIHLLKRVREQILKEPRAYCHASVRKITECGTTFCVAGWVLHFQDPHFVIERDRDGINQAAKVLRLTEQQGGELMNPLFDTNMNNRRIKTMYDWQARPETRAKAGAKHIDWFIQKYS